MKLTKNIIVIIMKYNKSNRTNNSYITITFAASFTLNLEKRITLLNICVCNELYSRVLKHLKNLQDDQESDQDDSSCLSTLLKL